MSEIKNTQLSGAYIYIEPGSEAKIIMQQQERILDLLQRIAELESEIKALKLIAKSHSMSELRRLQAQTGWRKHGEPPEPGSYKNARGVLNWKPGDETAVDAIRRLRGNDPPEQNERSK